MIAHRSPLPRHGKLGQAGWAKSIAPRTTNLSRQVADQSPARLESRLAYDPCKLELVRKNGTIGTVTFSSQREGIHHAKISTILFCAVALVATSAHAQYNSDAFLPQIANGSYGRAVFATTSFSSTTLITTNPRNCG